MRKRRPHTAVFACIGLMGLGLITIPLTQRFEGEVISGVLFLTGMIALVIVSLAMLARSLW